MSESPAPMLPPDPDSQRRLELDDSQAVEYYASLARAWFTPEEFYMDFAARFLRKPGQPDVTLLRPDARVVMPPAAAKRLAMAMMQSVRRYEEQYGTIETDPRRRARKAGNGVAESGPKSDV